MAGTVLAGANPATKAGSADGTATDGTEEKTESTDASAEEPDASLLALGVLPPPPPADPVLQANTGQSSQTSEPQGEVRADQGQGSVGQASSIAGRGLPSAGQVQSPAGVVQPSKGEVPAAGQGPLARPGVSVSVKSDPAVAVLDSAKTAEASVGTAALALPEGLSPIRESFDSILAGFSAAPATAPASGTSAPAAQAAQAATPASPPVPLGAVPMTIGLRSLQGSNHFEIRLDPGELGRIDVSLDIDKERGTVMAHLVVDRAETLALLQRDAGSLQQALSQAGLDAPEANINLSLRSDTQSGGQGAEGQGADGRRPEGRPGGPGLSHQAEGRAALEATPMRTLRGLTGLDIRI
ncbi:flagellar hook-length control protein FliK [Methylobacterium sp. J-090]|uniref:flagellar hook-length control protein FliK n=1 Tax=Methylobacterium sp. J-090 TaxID=2836666 RepID=UPI001FBBFB50|nr:flagellar hook-length control protein FliK [Methylobacterium sp. J-090]MCJ2080983.1 flagellar hook-length control protein FliK [Methylobacterium sp. J-090]